MDKCFDPALGSHECLGRLTLIFSLICHRSLYESMARTDCTLHEILRVNPTFFSLETTSVDMKREPQDLLYHLSTFCAAVLIKDATCAES